MSKFKQHFPAFFILVILMILGIFPLFHSGLYTAHDIWHQVARLYHYSTLVSLGEFPPRWVFDLAQGFGYPLFFFSYHFPWFFGSLLVLLGFSVETSLKMLFAGSYIAAGCSMYWLMYTLTKNRVASIVGAAAYLWAPYFFLSLYVAATIGTAFLFALLPILIISLHFLTQKNYVLGCVLLASLLAAALLTHVLTLTLLIPLLGSFWIFGFISTKERRKFFIWSVLAGILAVGLSAFYLLPLYSYLPLIAASTDSGGLTNNYTHYFASLKQLLYSPWGFGPIVSDAKQGEISLQVGIAQWLGGMFAIFLLLVTLFFRKNKLFQKYIVTKQQKYLAIFTGLFLLSIVLMLDVAKPFWLAWTKLFPLDFPFRLLLMSVFTGSLLIGLVLASIKKTWLQILLGGCFICIALYTNRNHVRVNLYTEVPLDLYVASETTTNTYHEYMPRSADSSVLNDDLQSFIPDSPEIVLSEQRSPIGVTAQINSPENQSVAIRQFAFPGVIVRVGGEIANKDIDGKGRIIIQVPAGNSEIKLSYEKPLLILLSEYISFASLVILTILFFRRKKLS
ncbi:MAG: hypothetical protein GW947_02505 [Candidatus Pacebacteria bacterium]|nr:hypothetical protein [Candidatus Paceibacterota bacterium]PIR61291.1 MAG: hypothetical protein COU68_00150 [Candidatus Pacebacteria bacterium CG10_big_fil_rev_8_21_14_0_10_45_6]